MPHPLRHFVLPQSIRSRYGFPSAESGWVRPPCCVRGKKTHTRSRDEPPGAGTVCCRPVKKPSQQTVARPGRAGDACVKSTSKSSCPFDHHERSILEMNRRNKGIANGMNAAYRQRDRRNLIDLDPQPADQGIEAAQIEVLHIVPQGFHHLTPGNRLPRFG